jgi:hypothetical protein
LLDVLANPTRVADLGIFVVQTILLSYCAHHLASHLISVSNLSITAPKSGLCDLLNADPILLLMHIIESLNRTSHYLLLGDAISSVVGSSHLRLLTGWLRHGRGLLGETFLPFLGAPLGRIRAVSRVAVA